MSTYIEYNDGDQPGASEKKLDTHRINHYAEYKSDGSGIVASESQFIPENLVNGPEYNNANDLDGDEKIIDSDPFNRDKSIFIRNKGGLKQPKFLVLIVVLFALIGAFVLSRIWSNEAVLSKFIIEGNHATLTKDIETAINPFIGMQMKEVYLANVIDSLSSLPFIQKVIATKELPDAIRIKIMERQAVASAIINQDYVWIDEDGFILNKSKNLSQTQRLPLLTGFKQSKRDYKSGLTKLDSAECFKALAFCKALQETEFAKLLISEVKISGPNEIKALSANAMSPFMFGQGDLTKQLENFELFWKQVVVKKGVSAFQYVDMRFEGKIFTKENDWSNRKTQK